MTQKFWRRREQASSRRFGTLRVKFSLWSLSSNALSETQTLLRALYSTVKASILGVLLLTLLLFVEMALVQYAGLGFIRAEPVTSIGDFLSVSVYVLAALLGFYLATVGIVLANAYQDVSAAVREVILSDTRTRTYRRLVGLSIGVGVGIVLINGLGLIAIGYLTIGVYAILVLLGGWAIGSLALGAFDLFNPILLSREPLRALYRSISQLDSKGFLLDDAVLRVTALNSDRLLQTLSELIHLATERKSINCDELAETINLLLGELQIYAGMKHQIPPTSGWFVPGISYPRWIESHDSTISVALETSTPLQAKMEPITDWFERRVAELTCTAIEACIATNNRDASIRIILDVASTAGVIAGCYRVDDSMTFASIIADHCWRLDLDNEASDAVLSVVPQVMTGLLLGWKRATDGWIAEIDRAISTGQWDNADSTKVEIRGPDRIWRAAQDLLQQIQAEHEIEGRRISPDWYLRARLAGECTIFAREFSDELPKLLLKFAGNETEKKISSKTQAAVCAETLQMLSKADLLSESVSSVVDELNRIQQVHELMATPEVTSLHNKIEGIRASTFEKTAECLAQLDPDNSKDAPDYFGQALYTLTHHIEQAMAEGNSDLVGRLFPKVLEASLKFHWHLIATYMPPTYDFSPAVYNPVLDILELSGLAMIYEDLRQDNSAESVRASWTDWLSNRADPETFAKGILGILELAQGIYMPMSQMRHRWETRLIDQILRAGYSRPEYVPIDPGEEERVKWQAPRLIRMLAVSESMPLLTVLPYEIFAAEVIVPFSGEEQHSLRKSRGLSRYYEEVEFQRINQATQQMGSEALDSHLEGQS